MGRIGVNLSLYCSALNVVSDKHSKTFYAISFEELVIWKWAQQN